MHAYKSGVTCAKDKTGAWRYLYQAKETPILRLCKRNNMANLTCWIFIETCWMSVEVL
jgi:hypothetical protein